MTKYLFILLFSVPSFAATPLATAKGWIANQVQLSGSPGADLTGSLENTGRPCVLSLTDKHDGGYYVVVYPLDEPRSVDDYVGVGVQGESEAQVLKADNRQLILHYDGDWGNKSRFNTLTIEIGSGGKVLKATGQSDLRKYTCIFEFLGS